jgi:flagellar protein FlaG
MTINSLGALAPAAVNIVTPAPQQSTSGQVEQNRVLSQAVRVVNNSSLTSQDQQLSLSLDPVTKIAVAKVVDPDTGEVLRQVPSEDVLRLAAYLEAQSSEEQAAEQAPQEKSW